MNITTTSEAMSNYEEWQLSCFGNILPNPNIEIEEPGEEEARRFQEWNELQHERLMHEYDYTN